MHSEFARVVHACLLGEHRTVFWTSLVCLSLLWRLQRRRKPSNRAPTDFNSFLREDRPFVKETHFDFFLKNAEETGVHQEKAKEQESIPEGVICIPIFFGTEYGFGKEVAESLAADLKQSGVYWPILLDMANHPEGLDFSSESALVMICSTQGDGVPPYEARSFCEWIFDGKMGDLSSNSVSVCALGDKTYAHFCRCGLKLKSALLESGAQEFVQSITVDKEDWKLINQWKHDILRSLGSLNLSKDSISRLKNALLLSSKSNDRSWSKQRPFAAKLLSRLDLCKVENQMDKKTMHLEIDISESGLKFLPGDAVGVYPKNDSKEALELITMLQEDPETMVRTPSWIGSLKTVCVSISLKDALLHYYDLRSPKDRLFELLAKSMKNGENGMLIGSESHACSLCTNQLIGSISKGSLLSKLQDSPHVREQYLEDRHVVDILREFQPRKLPIHEVLDCLRALQPRLYSISSSWLVDNTHLSMTVAEVRYQALGVNRQGVASTYLTERLKIGDELFIYIAPNPDFRLPEDLTKPIVMIGPGTGIAPFRAFIQEKLHKRGETGKNLLFFGCRRRDQDYLYQDQLESWNQTGIIELHTAFSREQEEKIYVQHRLWEIGEEIWKLITEGCYIYVCGDAKHMAPSVERCLVSIFKSYGELQEKEATQVLETLQETKQYQRDVWF